MDIFEQIENLANRGIIIDCVAVNQEQNGYGDQVKNGTMPLVTYTVEIMDTSLEVLYAESCNNFKTALDAGLKAANKLVNYPPMNWQGMLKNKGVKNMNEVEKLIEESGKAEEIFKVLKSTQSMSDVADTIESLDENMAKLVLKKFVYSRGQ